MLKAIHEHLNKILIYGHLIKFSLCEMCELFRWQEKKQEMETKQKPTIAALYRKIPHKNLYSNNNSRIKP